MAFIRRATLLFLIFFLSILVIGQRPDSSKVYIVGASSNFYPFSFTEGKTSKGYSVDLIKHISKEMNLPVKVVTGNWPNIYKAFLDGKIDILFATAYSPERDSLIDFSASYFKIHFSIFKKKELKIKQLKDLNNKRITVTKSGIAHEWLLKQIKNGLNAQIIIASNNIDALHGVNSNNFDAAIIPEYLGSHIIEQNKLKNTVNTHIKLFSENLRFGVHEENSELLFTLGEGLLLAQTTNSLQYLNEKWLKPEEFQISSKWRKFIYILLILILLLVTFNTLLRRQVNKKTRELKKIFSQKEEKERLLNEKEEIFKEVVDNMPVSVDAIDKNGNVVFWSTASEEITGYSREEIMGKNLFEILYPNTKEREKMHKAILNMHDTNKIIQHQREFTHKDGSKRTLISNIIFDIKPLPKWHTWAVSMDITEKIQTENQLKLSEDRYKSALQAINDGLWEWNIKTNEVFFSPRWYTMLGYNPNEFPAGIKTWLILIHKDDKQDIFDENIRMAKKGEPYILEYRMKTKHEGYQWIRQRSRGTEFDNEGNPLKILGITSNISKEKNIKKELIQAKEKAEENDRLKSAFLANMSHEIRTPLNAIMGFTRLLGTEDANPDQVKDYVQIINSSGKQLLDLLNDIMDISKIEVNQLRIRKTVINLHNVLSEEFKLQQKNGNFNTNIEFRQNLNSLPKEIQIETDEVRLRQILNNLLSNAFKFTSSGFIELGVKYTSNQIEIYVQDSGIGIPEEKINQIFDRFVRVEDKTIFAEGTGIGLTISKELCRLLDTELQVESNKNKGSRFYFIVKQ